MDAWIIPVSEELDNFIASSSSSTQSVVSGRHFFTQEKLACLVEVSVIEQILQKFSEIVGNWACWNSVYELASFFSTHAWEPGSEGSTSSQQKSSMSLDLCFILTALHCLKTALVPVYTNKIISIARPWLCYVNYVNRMSSLLCYKTKQTEIM